ncbi:MAG: HD domain-containing protein [Oscillospiraceae bacterium]|nr:HD domain-containing protein [Oscillospiraceae bacterium]
MLSCMADSAHDREHVYRVLYSALDIASEEQYADYDVIITACLLHDIGRAAQLADPSLCHAEVGSEMAYRFLKDNGFSESFSQHVRQCILTHRFRKSSPPESIEAKILFDADKLDAAGAVGIARTLVYKGALGEPLYNVLPDGSISDGSADTAQSFFREYRTKLEKIYSGFYTQRGRLLAEARRTAAVSFYDSLYSEVTSPRKRGSEELECLLR